MNHISPYPGLTAFDEAHSQVFFGREEFVESLLRSLRNHRLVAIVGPSGVGKTSVLRAGLIPALLRQAPPPRVAYMRPGVLPFRSLASALEYGASVEPYDSESVKQKWHASPPDVLIIDQFEELYAISERSEVGAFIDLLVSEAETERTRSVISVRRSGSQTPLLRSGPLRTVRACRHAHGSSRLLTAFIIGFSCRFFLVRALTSLPPALFPVP